MAKKKKHEEHENHERWLVSYADFITLLFAFFVILYATSQKDLAKQQEVQKSIAKAFDPMVEFGGLIGKFIDLNDNQAIIPPPIPVVPQEGSIQEVQNAIERVLESEMGEKEFHDLVEVRHDRVGVRVALQASGFFDSGSTLIREESLAALTKIGKVLKATGRDLIVEGHTDNQPISSSKYASNWELSAVRATTIVRYLISRHEIPAAKLAAIAYSDQRPLGPNDTPENRSKNRRIEVLIVMNPQAQQ